MKTVWVVLNWYDGCLSGIFSTRAKALAYLTKLREADKYDHWKTVWPIEWEIDAIDEHEFIVP